MTVSLKNLGDHQIDIRKAGRPLFPRATARLLHHVWRECPKFLPFALRGQHLNVGQVLIGAIQAGNGGFVSGRQLLDSSTSGNLTWAL
jgi:hypothetical protein